MTLPHHLPLRRFQLFNPTYKLSYLYNDVYLTFLGGDYRCTLDAVYSLQTFVDPINHFENIAIIASPISVTTMRICWRHPNATACTHQTLPTPRPVILTFVDFGIHFVA